ncbi:MAG: glutathione S-transferase [Rudaea sp.]|uniref:glutathione S-transferase n=1 Tax=Rudaea sp. TaxID=2136325 RepID=UPI0039E38AFC
MQLIGMLDSPYVRRAAVSLQLLGVPFTHRSLSVFRGFEEFRTINPVVKAPTLVCDDGTVLVDSGLIIDYAQALAGRSLAPREPAALRRVLRITGLALAVAEKSVQIYYECELRPPAARHAPWMERVSAQLHAACVALEAELARPPSPTDRAGVVTAVAWRFSRGVVPDAIAALDCPRLDAFSAAAEALPEYRAAPFGDGTYPVAGA